MNNYEAEFAIKAFILYYKKYLGNEAAFNLPNWYIEARKVVGEERTKQLWEETYEELNEIL